MIRKKNQLISQIYAIVRKKVKLMKNNIKNISAIIFLIPFVFLSCAGNSRENNHKAIIGGVGGAAAGGLMASASGANTAGVIGDMILGGLLGGAVGDRMDVADRHCNTDRPSRNSIFLTFLLVPINSEIGRYPSSVFLSATSEALTNC